MSLRKRIEKLETADAATNDRSGWFCWWPVANHPGDPTPEELEQIERLLGDGSNDPLPVEEELKSLAVGIDAAGDELE